MMTLTLQESNKLSWMRLVCACMVVCIHVPAGGGQTMAWCANRLLGNYLCWMAVPFFFLSSGYLLACKSECRFSNWYGKEVRKRVKSILIPFFLWNLLALVFVPVLRLIAAPQQWRSCLEALPGDWLAKTVGYCWWDYPMHMPSWYLRALFIFAFCAPLILLLVRRIGRFGCVILVIVAGIITVWTQQTIDDLRMILNYVIPVNGLAYFALGASFAMNGIPKIPASLSRLSAALVILFGMFAIWFDYHGGGLKFLFSVLGIIPAIILFWNLIPICELPKAISSLSFPIFLIHPFVLTFGGLILKGRVSADVAYIVLLVLGVVGSACIAIGIKRISPRLSALMFGGR